MLCKSVCGYVPASFPVNVAVDPFDLARTGGDCEAAGSQECAPEMSVTDTNTLKAGTLFTPRQAAVVEALRHGKPNKIIAYELKITESTVKVHIRNIMKKLRATNRTQVAYLVNSLNSE
jgi:DNA-binding NarL/FixJ family response regulator